MGSNDRLKEIAKAAEFDKFILLRPLNRSKWYPPGLKYCEVNDASREASTDDDARQADPSNKVCADVIEAIIGLVFIEFGYDQCSKVAEEIGASSSAGHMVDVCRKWADDMLPAQDLVSFACKFVGVQTFHNPRLLVEATTHQSCLHKPVPSYQRLEWVGDAVLCLAAREWLFRREEVLSVPKLVVLETTLVCKLFAFFSIVL